LYFAGITFPARYIISRRGTQLVLFRHNTYTPNSKIKPESLKRDWKCSMYHKAKCKARLVTKFTSAGDIIHVTCAMHSHPDMYPPIQHPPMFFKPPK
ncbi:pre-mod(mdg4)-AD, partial [Musca autumnalis]|uniref:pre-mod(mdg4)-AD n=1 Tax=Musca autumnalis TaxID=221902 RepID=UPI003CEF2F4A